MMKTHNFILMCCLFLWCVAAQATVYKSVDAHGNVIYSDNPNKGHEVELKPLTTYTPPARVEKLAPMPVDAVASAPKISIVTPADKETIWDNLGNATVKFNINQNLTENQKIEVILDGQPFISTVDNTIVLNGIERGEHTLMAQVLDQEGNVIATSNSVIIYMHQTTVKQNRPTPIR